MPGGGSGQPFAQTTMPTKNAIEVRFGILGDEEVRRMSVAEIRNELGYTRSLGPQSEGIHDPRMGTGDRDQICATCHSNYTDCPGHFGHIQLAMPVFHPGYVNNIIKVLRCICFECGALRLRDKHVIQSIQKRQSAPTRFRLIFEACNKIQSCKDEREDSETGCGQIQPRYKREGLTIWRENQGPKGPGAPTSGQSDQKKILKPEEVIKIFKKISDENIRLMGMDPKNSRPEWMIISALAVSPPPVRPTVEAGDGCKSIDDLSHSYTQILRRNNELQKQVDDGFPEKVQQDSMQQIQLLVATMMDNNQPDLPKQRHTGGRPIKCIRSRLKGKEGRVRWNLMGKRVDFSARTVITPDPILQLDQLGVPMLIATNLTVPEYVTRQNLDQMKQLVANGPTKWPGAKYIIRLDGRQIDLSVLKDKAQPHLDPGCIVERHLRDDDYVIFNRQPSLHKMSLMGHRVKVLPFQTFRLNLSVTSPYNADFDGDEMNMHVPQSYETKAEVKEIMAVPKQIVAPKDNKPVMGIVQDSLLGIMLFTLRDTFLEMDRVMNLLMWIDYTGMLPTPAIIKPRPLWTGKQILSLVLPELNYSRPSDKFKGWACPLDSNILVKNGELLCGMLTKANVGSSAGGMIHIVWRDLGPEATKLFMSNTQNIVNNWLVGNGFSVGVQDIVAKEQTVKLIERALGKYKRIVKRICQRTQQGKLEILPGKGMLESFEFEVNRVLRAALEKSGALALETLEPWNRLNNMVTSGSKGSKLNISQIMACCGQQNVEGKRIPFGFNRRTLPHFSKDDFGPESKGFVSSCYFFGLTPSEFYFHAMGGREGLIDTACKTAETGYIQRRLIKAMEDIQVKYDQTVRTSRDQIIQFLYGEDGMSSEYIENMRIPLMKMDNKQLKKTHEFFNQEQTPAERKQILFEKLQDDIMENINIDELSEALNEEFKQIEEDREALRNFIFLNGNDAVYLPVNVPRLVWNAKEKFRVKPHLKTDLDPLYVIEKTRDLLNSMSKEGLKIYQEKRMEKSELITDANENATWLIKIYLRQILSAKHLIMQQNLTKNSFDSLLGEIRDRYNTSIVHPGEMVGSIGAQAMGEPATQMTLNTFHLAGVSKSVTLGVPRLKEVINVAKTIKTPSLTIILEEAYRQDDIIARKVGNAIEYTNLCHVVAQSAIYYDPDPTKTIIRADEELLQMYQESNIAGDELSESLSPWIIRFEIDNSKLRGRDLTIEYIEQILQSNLFEDLNIVRNMDLQDLKKLVLRIRPPDFSPEEENVPTALRKVETELLNSLILKGFPEITKVFYQKNADASSMHFFDKVTGKMEKADKNWVIETDGVALKKVLAVDKVDHRLTTSNSVIEILQTLGIEAARQSLIKELRFVLDSYDIYVNYRHLSTLCDVMTNRGILTAITRHGINRIDSGALRKCSFEETVEILLEASFHSEVDPLSGITENIIMGQLAPYGTGCFDLMMDTSELKEAYQEQAEVYNFQDGNNHGMGQNGDSTPQWLSPQIILQGGLGETSYYDGTGTQYNMQGFTPAPDSPNSPVAYTPGYKESEYRSNQLGGNSPLYISGGMTARSPIPGLPTGGQTGYSPTSPAYMKIPGTPGMGMGMGAGATPSYYRGIGQTGIGQGASPSYYRQTGQGYGNMQGAAYTPYSPVPNNPIYSGANQTSVYGSAANITPNAGGYQSNYQPIDAAYTPGGNYDGMYGSGQTPGYKPTQPKNQDKEKEKKN